MDPLQLGARDLTRAPSAERADRRLRSSRRQHVSSPGVEVAELHAPFSHQELILRRELGLGDDVRINPSGGALASNPMFTSGLNRIGEAARRVWDGSPTRCSAMPPAARPSSRTSCA